YATAQGAHRFAKRRERMVNLVEWHRDGLAVLNKLALLQATYRGENGNSQRFLDFARRGIAGPQHFHCESAADTESKPGQQCGQQDLSDIGKGLTTSLRRHNDPDITRPKRRLLVGNFGLLQKVLEQGLVHRRRSLQFTQSSGNVIIG